MNPPSIPHPAEALILAKVAPAVLDRVRQVRVMAFDVDGVLTDGGLWYGEQGEVMKCFNSLDGHGLRKGVIWLQRVAAAENGGYE